MNDIDLIPEEYRKMVGRLREFKLYIVAAIFIALLGSVGSWGLLQWSGSMDRQHQQLMQQHAVSNRQSEELTSLSDQRNKLLKQRDTLFRLRGGGTATDLIMVIDRALPGEDIWFLNWRFQRSGNDDSEMFSGTANASDAGAMTSMNITGQSVDHAALSKFVRALFDQAEIHDVKLRQTSVRRYHTHSVVDFELAIVLKAGA